MFCLHIKQDKVPTKRSVLRSIASIYDPLGLLSPIIIQCKIFMQQFWQLKVNWDDPLNTEVKEHWQGIQQNLPMIRCMLIDRLAYRACLYIRSIDVHGKITTKLLCSKPRVAPLKSLSLPRLELCAAVLLADMYQASSRALKISSNKIRFWRLTRWWYLLG